MTFRLAATVGTLAFASAAVAQPAIVPGEAETPICRAMPAKARRWRRSRIAGQR